MPKVKWSGEGAYSGTDPVGNLSVFIAPGDSAEVSDAKANQMLADFPGMAEVVGGEKPKTADGPKKAAKD